MPPSSVTSLVTLYASRKISSWVTDIDYTIIHSATSELVQWVAQNLLYIDIEYQYILSLLHPANLLAPLALILTVTAGYHYREWINTLLSTKEVIIKLDTTNRRRFLLYFDYIAHNYRLDLTNLDYAETYYGEAPLLYHNKEGKKIFYKDPLFDQQMFFFYTDTNNYLHLGTKHRNISYLKNYINYIYYTLKEKVIPTNYDCDVSLSTGIYEDASETFYTVTPETVYMKTEHFVNKHSSTIFTIKQKTAAQEKIVLLDFKKLNRNRDDTALYLFRYDNRISFYYVETTTGSTLKFHNQPDADEVINVLVRYNLLYDSSRLVKSNIKIIATDGKFTTQQYYNLDEFNQPIDHFKYFFHPQKKRLLDQCVAGYGMMQNNLILYGPGGTGKTSFIRNLARTLNIKIYTIDISKYRTVNSLKNAFNQEGIIVMDEFDIAVKRLIENQQQCDRLMEKAEEFFRYSTEFRFHHNEQKNNTEENGNNNHEHENNGESYTDSDNNGDDDNNGEYDYISNLDKLEDELEKLKNKPTIRDLNTILNGVENENPRLIIVAATNYYQYIKEQSLELVRSQRLTPVEFEYGDHTFITQVTSAYFQNAQVPEIQQQARYEQSGVIEIVERLKCTFIKDNYKRLIQQHYQPDLSTHNGQTMLQIPPLYNKETRNHRLETLKHRVKIDDPQLYREFLQQITLHRKDKWTQNRHHLHLTTNTIINASPKGNF